MNKTAKILIVDDESISRRSLLHILDSFNYINLETVKSGYDALDAFKNEKYHLLITDIGMPGMNGLELIKQVHEISPLTTCLIFTGQSVQENAKMVIQTGVFDYVSKPITDFELFHTVIEKAIERSNLLRSNAEMTDILKHKNEELENSVIDLTVAYNILDDHIKSVQADLAHAQVLQKAFLHNSLADSYNIPGFSIGCVYQPSDRIGGDFYGSFQLPDNKLAIYIGDASGHGVSACLLMALYQHHISLNRLEKNHDALLNPAEFLTTLNNFFFTLVFESNKFATMVYMVIDQNTGFVTYSSAGHTPILAKGLYDNVDLYFSNGKPLGIDGKAIFTNHCFNIKDYSYITLYTDGLIETVHDINTTSPFDINALKKIHLAPNENPQVFSNIIYELYQKHLGENEQDDDVTILVIRTGTEYDVKQFYPMSIEEIQKNLLTTKKDSKPVLRDKLLETSYDDKTLYIKVTGIADWTIAEVLSIKINSAVDAGIKNIFIDADKTKYMDSTFLGLLQETIIISHKYDASVCFYIKNQRLIDDIKELYLTDVIARLSDTKPKWLKPFEPVLHSAGMKDPSVKKLILRAHNILSEINTNNKEKFHSVISLLKKEVAKINE